MDGLCRDPAGRGRHITTRRSMVSTRLPIAIAGANGVMQTPMNMSKMLYVSGLRFTLECGQDSFLVLV